ncbi:MAG TPA: hypothetical protein VGK38_01285, partial [Prolixibacteraceae bacterium]
MKHFIQLTLILCVISLFGANANENRWKINESGGISWLVTDQLPHRDHIEMSGKYVSAVIRYGVDADKSFWINRDIVWPMLRTIPNNTHASLTRSFNLDPVKMISVNKRLVLQETVNEIILDGKITVKSTLNETI